MHTFVRQLSVEKWRLLSSVSHKPRYRMKTQKVSAEKSGGFQCDVKCAAVTLLSLYLIYDFAGCVFFGLGLVSKGRGIAVMEATKADYFGEYKRGNVTTEEYE